MFSGCVSSLAGLVLEVGRKKMAVRVKGRSGHYFYDRIHSRGGYLSLLYSPGLSRTMAAFVVCVALQSVLKDSAPCLSAFSTFSVFGLCFGYVHHWTVLIFFMIFFMEAIFTSPKLSLQAKLFSCNNLPLTLLSDTAHPVSSI